MQGVTRNEIKFIECYKRFYDAHGYSPRYEDLMEMMNVKSKSTIARIVNQLEQKDMIIRHKSRPRGLILNMGVCATCGQKTPVRQS